MIAQVEGMNARGRSSCLVTRHLPLERVMAVRATMRWRALIVLCLLAGTVAAPAGAGEHLHNRGQDRDVEIVDLGVVPEAASWATHVTDGGMVFGARTFAVGPFSSARSWRWDDGIVVDLPGYGQGSAVTAVNDRGDAVGYLITALELSLTRAVLWPRDGTLVELGDPDLQSLAHDVNGAGVVVGEAQTDPAELAHAAVWRDGEMTLLEDGGAVGSSAVAIDNRGRVAGHVVDDEFRRHAVVWHRGTMSAFTLPDVDESSEAVDLNRRGQVLVRAVWTDDDGEQVERWYVWDRTTTEELPVVLSSGHLTDRRLVVGTTFPLAPHDPAPRAVRVDDGVVTDLGSLGQGARVAASNERGQVVGSSGVPSDVPGAPFEHAVLFDDGDVVDLGTLGGPTSEASDINRRGRIVGRATLDDEAGTVRAVMWTVGR